MGSALGLYTEIPVPDTAELEESNPIGWLRPNPRTPWLSWQSKPRSWWLWVLLGVAGYLTVSFGGQIWDDYQSAENGLGMLRGTEGLGLMVQVDPFHYTIRNVVASATAWETYVLAEQQLNHDLTAVSVGAIALLLALGSMARRRLLDERDVLLPMNGQARSSASALVLSIAVKVWAMGEGVFLSIYCLLLVAFCIIAIFGLLQGEQLSWLFADKTVNRTIDVLASVLQLIR